MERMPFRELCAMTKLPEFHCFHCEKDVSQRNLGFLRICPVCLHILCHDCQEKKKTPCPGRQNVLYLEQSKIKQSLKLPAQPGDSWLPVLQIFAEQGMIRRDLINWRIAKDQPYGSINGLPQLSGQCLATNGIECLVMQGDGRCFIGHYDFFVEDTDRISGLEKKACKTCKTRKTRKANKNDLAREILLAIFQ
jgi:hypothetical protein